MKTIPADDPLAVNLIQAIQGGNTELLQQLLSEDSERARLSIEDSDKSIYRSLLHVATDWPGHFPNVAETIQILLASGADPNVGVAGEKTETPLHWAASSNDVVAIEQLVKAGADLEAPGSVIAGGAPLENAIGFQNWAAAHFLADRGAKTRIGDEAALGHMNRLKQRLEADEKPAQESLDYAFWNACCAGEKFAARYLFANGADINWIPDWCDDTPLDGAVNSGEQELIHWLDSIGGKRNQKDA